MGYSNEWSHGDKTVDWDKVKMSAPEPPVPGLYELKVMTAELTETSGKDKQGKDKQKSPMGKVRLEIVSARDAAGEEFIGRTVFDNWVFSTEGAFKVKNAAIVAGKDLPASLEYDELSGFMASFEGETITAMLDTRTYEGKKNPMVRYYGEEAPSDDENGARNGGGREAHPPRAEKGGKGGKQQSGKRR